MGIINRLINAWNMASTFDILTALNAQRNSKAGANVTWRTALEASTSMACARVLGNGIGQVPFKLMKYDGKTRQPATELELYRVLHDAPNEWMTAYEYRVMMMMHILFCGAHYSFVNRVGGDVIELLPFEPQQVTVRRDGWNLFYEVHFDGGKPQNIPAANMWHVRGPSWNGWMGLEGVKVARDAIGLSIATEEHGSLLFRNGAQGSGLLTTDSQLNAEKAKELREAWQDSQAGENRFKTAVLWGGMKWTPMSSPNDTTQFLETRKFQVEEICRALGVMPIMVGATDKTATYASSEQMFIAHVVHDLSPRGVMIEQSANMKLLTPEQRKRGYYTKIMFNGLMRGSAKERSEYYKAALGAGGSPPWLTQDEVLELEDMNPMGGNAAYLREPSNVGGTNEPETL